MKFLRRGRGESNEMGFGGGCEYDGGFDTQSIGFFCFCFLARTYLFDVSEL